MKPSTRTCAIVSGLLAALFLAQCEALAQSVQLFAGGARNDGRPAQLTVMGLPTATYNARGDLFVADRLSHSVGLINGAKRGATITRERLRNRWLILSRQACFHGHQCQ